MIRHLSGPGGRTLILAIGMVWTVFFALLIFRAYAVASTDERLCLVIRRIVEPSSIALGKPGDPPPAPGVPGAAYYRDHLDELEAVRRQNANTLALLNCKDLPTGGG